MSLQFNKRSITMKKTGNNAILSRSITTQTVYTLLQRKRIIALVG